MSDQVPLTVRCTRDVVVAFRTKHNLQWCDSRADETRYERSDRMGAMRLFAVGLGFRL